MCIRDRRYLARGSLRPHPDPRRSERPPHEGLPSEDPNWCLRRAVGAVWKGPGSQWPRSEELSLIHI
eukprot:3809968-Alexandrium_andersonii.AAC.1